MGGLLVAGGVLWNHWADHHHGNRFLGDSPALLFRVLGEAGRVLYPLDPETADRVGPYIQGGYRVRVRSLLLAAKL